LTGKIVCILSQKTNDAFWIYVKLSSSGKIGTIFAANPVTTPDVNGRWSAIDVRHHQHIKKFYNTFVLGFDVKNR